MPRDRDFKRLVRRRMGKTGEAYTSARAQVVRDGGRPRPSASPPGGAATENFERFTGRARRALAAAHAEAAGGVVGGEHLLLGLFHVADGMAAKAMHQMGVDLAVLERRLRAAPAVPSDGALSAAATRAIELLGIVREGTSAGARALAGAGVSLDRARRRIGEAHVVGPRPEPAEREAPAQAWRPLAGTGVRGLLEAASAERATGTLTLRRDGARTATCTSCSATCSTRPPERRWATRRSWPPWPGPRATTPSTGGPGCPGWGPSGRRSPTCWPAPAPESG
jgi:hypothetical protein